MAAGLNADLKTYRVTLSVTREEASIWKRSGRARWLEGIFVEATYAYRQIKVTCAGWSARVGMLRVEFSAEFKQVVN